MRDCDPIPSLTADLNRVLLVGALCEAPEVRELGEGSAISGGDSKFGSYFVDASPDGSNVFFVTAERLTGWDVDGSVDLYDARINGGVLDPAAPACVGDTCQPPPVALNDRTPSSSSFTGPGIRCVERPVKHKRVVKHKLVKKASRKRARHAKRGRHGRAVKGGRGSAK
ncbi:MAG: hypothetical protein WBV85_01440 [Solirubrobacteraceae bacterium]